MRNWIETNAAIPFQRCALALFIAVLGITQGQARGDKRPRVHVSETSIAFLGVSGHGGTKIGDGLEWALAERYRVYPGEVYRSVALKLGKTGASPEEVSAVATRLRLQAIIAGSVRDENGKKFLRINVRDGATGKVLARIDDRLSPAGTLSASGELRVLESTVLLIDKCVGAQWEGKVAAGTTLEGTTDDEPVAIKRGRPAPSEDETDDDEDDETAKGRHVAARETVADDDELPAPRRRPNRATDDEDSIPDASTKPRNVSASLRKKAPSMRPTEGVTLDVGYAFLGRTLDINAPGALPYHGGVVSAIRIDASAFPVAWTPSLVRAHPVLACFGIAISAVIAAPFSSLTAPGQTVPASAHRWDASLAARIPLRRAGDYALRLTGGTGQLSYSSNEPNLLGVPDVSYQTLRQSIGLSLPLGTNRVVLDVTGAVFAIVDPGSIGALTEYGNGASWGGDFETSLTVRATSWLYFATMVHYASVNMNFHGDGARLGTGAHDQFVDGGLVIGYAVR